MKKKILLGAIMYTISLFAFTSPASAQEQNNEYKETLKKMITLSGASAATDQIMPQLMSVIKKMSPETDNQVLEEFITTWTKKLENKVLDIYTPIYQRYLSLNELKKVIAFYESPVGKKLGMAAPVMMTEAMPMIQEYCGEMMQDMMKLNGQKEFTTITGNENRNSNSSNDSILNKRKQRDQQLFAQAYTAPKDSIQLSGLPYEPGVTAPTLYSIERRKNDTRVTFSAPIYFDSQWLHFGRGLKIIDKKSGDEYNVRGYDGGTPFGKLLIIQGFNEKCIFVSLIFPKLKKNVKMVDILELPHETDVLPSNDDGKAREYFDIEIKDYSPASLKAKGEGGSNVNKNKKIYN